MAQKKGKKTFIVEEETTLQATIPVKLYYQLIAMKADLNVKNWGSFFQKIVDDHSAKKGS